jgi:predicted AAA+ superfamily ATPase
MATSNRDRIGQMFDLLSEPLGRFIADVLGPELPAGSSWIQLVALKDSENGITGKTYSAEDPLVQLRMLTENIPHQVKKGWFPFDGRLSHGQKSFASELRETRNSWAHGGSFNDDDAYRALDTAERLLNSIQEPAVADQVARIRLNLRRVTAEKDDKRTLRAAATNSGSDGLRPWRDVLVPHTDVATGNFASSEFAADLYKVANEPGDAGSDYADPVEFFARTYLTDGLRDLITIAVRRLSGDDNAPPVVNLQTNFGGGKTHSMLSLWHLADGRPRGVFPQDVQELIGAAGYDKIPAGVRRVAIVGNHFSPSGERKPDGTVVRTIWGELAWQLGGADAFAIVAESDAASTHPGAALHQLLAAYSPAVILIDEWVAYARSLFDRDDLAGGTFDDQFTFAQALTEAAKGTSGVLLAISIPASHTGDDGAPAVGSAEEVGGTHGLEALRRLQNVVRRVAHQWRHASSDEAYHIVRRRLFTTPDAAALAEIGNTARAFVEYYRKHHDDFPREAREAAYEERIKQTYPIHPELFDRLYQDWSSLERFQRTRGVLRLMSSVIHALWISEDPSPLVMPGSIPLASASVNPELTQYLQDSWKAVIDADVDGPNSEPVKIDTAKPLFGQRHLTKRLARTVFFGAAPTIGSAHKGLDTQRVFLGTAVPGDVPGNFHAALTQLADRATYFYSGSGKYWYDLQANITRRAKDQAERLHPEDVWAEIVRRLADQGRRSGDFARIHVCPDDSGDIPDIDEARLVILHPKLTHKRTIADSTAMVFAQRATENRGSAARLNRNMVVYLAADADRMDELDTAVRNYLGWQHVLDNAADLDLTDNQRRQATEKRHQEDETAGSRLLGAYQWALVPTSPDPSAPFVIEAVKAEGQAASLAERVSKRLGNDGALSTRQAASTIRLALARIPALWASGHVAVGALWKTYADYPYMPRLRDQSVLVAGLTDQPLLWQQDGFALAAGYDGERYQALWIPGDPRPPAITDTTLIVQPARAAAQRADDVAQASAAPAPAADGGSSAAGAQGGTAGVTHPGGGAGFGGSGQATSPPAKPSKKRYFGSRELTADRYALDFKKISDEVIAHLAAAPGVRLTVRLEIEASTPEGFDDARARTVSENATQLKFDQSAFEEE